MGVSRRGTLFTSTEKAMINYIGQGVLNLSEKGIEAHVSSAVLIKSFAILTSCVCSSVVYKEEYCPSSAFLWTTISSDRYMPKYSRAKNILNEISYRKWMMYNPVLFISQCLEKEKLPSGEQHHSKIFARREQSARGLKAEARMTISFGMSQLCKQPKHFESLK